MNVLVNKKDEIIMQLVHYFVTYEDYSPMVVNGVKDEIWLQNQSGPYKIIRINSNYIHNKEQYDYDLLKIDNITKQVKRKTLAWRMNVLNILLDVNDNVKLENSKNIASVKLKNTKNIKEENIISKYPDINDKILLESGLDLMIDVTNDINDKTEKENKVYESIFKPKKIVITNILIFINVLMFFVVFAASKANITAGALVSFGALYAPLVKNGEIFRLITTGFLHGGVLHLLFNMYALYLIGTQLEGFIGKKNFLIIYFYSLISASLMSMIINPYTVSVGASGAIFGLLGSLLYFGYQYRLYLGSVMKTQIIPVIVINLIFGFTMSGIDNAAHIGGLIGGALIAMALGVQQKEDKELKLNGLVVSIIYIAFLVYIALFR